MKRYIDGEKLYKVVHSVADMPYDAIDFLHTIKNFPTEDVRPVVRGKWIHFSMGDQCSKCGYDTGKYEEGRNFCPNCGADMREVEE